MGRDDRKTVLIMAAGMGSRYGGVKQMEPVGPRGELIIDYSIYDALHAGFGRVVFVIKPEMERDFFDVIGRRIARHIDTAYAFQHLDALPPGWALPEGRVKPWGTTHAVLAAADLIDGPFAVVNADDYYGRRAFELMSGWLDEADTGGGVMHHSMISYTLERTLSSAGGVTRGECRIGADGRLAGVSERRGVERDGAGVKFKQPDGGWGAMPLDAQVSMNFWGLDPRFFDAAREAFPKFLDAHKDDITSCEFLLPDTIDEQLRAGTAVVDVMPSDDKWYGVTYREDRALVRAAIADLHGSTCYPFPLWEE